MSDGEENVFLNEGVFSSASIKDFFAEADEQLAGIEEQLLILDEQRSRSEAITEIFRHLHGLKGNSGLILSEAEVSLPPEHAIFYLQKGSHSIETLVDQYRKAQTFELSDEDMAFLFEVLDFLQKQLIAFRSDRIFPVRNELFLARLGLSFSDFADASKVSEAVDAIDVFSDAAGQNIRAARAFINQFANGETASLTNLNRSFETLLRVARYAGRLTIAKAVEFQLQVLRGPLSVSNSTLLATELQEIESLQKQIEGEFESLEVRPESKEVPLQNILDEGPPESKKQASIRVEQGKIDDLLRMAGELLVLQNSLIEIEKKLSVSGVEDATARDLRSFAKSFYRASDEIRDAVVELRLFPLRGLFKRFQRLTRDLSVSLNKQIRLVTTGDEIELDKTLLDQIGEPLGHLLRNAADHGIEASQARLSRQKSEFGTIAFRAHRQGTMVVIEVSDDGQGIDPKKIADRAEKMGLPLPQNSADWDFSDLNELIFAPGFSTTENVTSLSGRGVGLDVVRNAVRRMQGTLTVESKLGIGTTFRIAIPTTLLVSQGVLLMAGEEEYILPIDSIRDLVRIDGDQIYEYQGVQLVPFESGGLPIFSLHSVLHPSAPSRFPITGSSELSIVVVEHSEGPYGMAVDGFKGEVRIIIKPMGAELSAYNFYAGAAILGTGRVVLVLNSDALRGAVLGEQ